MLEPEVGQGSHHKGPHAFTLGVRIHLVGDENDTRSAKDNTSGKRSTRDKVPEKNIFAIILLIIPNALQWSCRRTESVAYLDTMTMEGIYMSPKPMPVITL